MQNTSSDSQSQDILATMNEQDRVKTSRIAGVRTVLVVLSSKGIVFDTYALRHEIRLAYPDATVFFRTTLGQAIGAPAPAYVDLLVDLTGPGQRQPWLYARKLRRGSRVAVGRNAGLFRKGSYDRVFDEKKGIELPYETLEKERIVQKKVLELAGIAFVPTGETPPDLGKTIALELPPMQRL
jgi:hypothetical protein